MNNKRFVLCFPSLIKLITILVFSFSSHSVFSQLDIIHYVPPLYAGTTSNGDIGNHWVVLTTPSEEDITVTIRRGDGRLVVTVPNVSKDSPRKFYFNRYRDKEGSNVYISAPPLGVVNNTSLNQVITDQGLIFTSRNSAGKNVPFYVNIRHRSEIHGLSLTAKGQVAKGKSFRTGHLYSVRGENVNGWGGRTYVKGHYEGSWPRRTWVSSYYEYHDNNIVNHRSHFISVMATEDNTVVAFSDIKVGNLTSSTKEALTVSDITTDFNTAKSVSDFTDDHVFNVILDAGESYVLGADLKFLIEDEANSLNGTHITSTKPIVVNSGSWCGGRSLNSWQDMGADQIVPERLVGQEYILLKGEGNDETERPIVVATKDNTEIRVNDSPTVIQTLLKAGDSYAIPTSDFINDVMFIKTSENAYLYQTTSASNLVTSGIDYAHATIGMNFIPPLSTLGFRQVDIPFVPGALGKTGVVAIYAQKGADVYVNGVALIPTTAKNVTGNIEWVVYKHYVVPSDDAGVHVSVQSTKAIYVALTVESTAVGAAGYFSGFTKSITPINTTVAFDYKLGYVCSNVGGNLDLAINSKPLPDSYDWYRDEVKPENLEFHDENLNVPIPTVPTKFILKAYFRDIYMDRLINGDFTIDDGGFTTDLDPFNASRLEVPGKVKLTSNPKSINPNFEFFTDLNDPAGMMLLAHSSGSGIHETIWQQTYIDRIQIPGNLFILKVYGRLAEAGKPQYLDILVNDKIIESNFQLNNIGEWQSTKAFWRAGDSETIAKISIVDANAPGHDAVFALDSISFVPAIEATKVFDPEIVPSYTYKPFDDDLHLCKGDVLAVADIKYGDMEWFTFLWEQKKIGEKTFSTITDPTITGLDTYELKFNNVVDDHAGIYRCIIGFKKTYEQCGIDADPTSIQVKVIVDEPASIISLNPRIDICGKKGTDVVVEVDGIYSSIDWLVFQDDDVVPTQGGHESSFRFNPDADYLAGNYTVRCDVENACGDLSRNTSIVIHEKPVLAAFEVPNNLCDQRSAELKAFVEGVDKYEEIEYSWYRNGESVPMAVNNESIYKITPDINNDKNYKVAVAALYDIGQADKFVCKGDEQIINLDDYPIDPQFVIEALGNVSLCEGDSYPYKAKLTSTTGSYTYNWDLGGVKVGEKPGFSANKKGVYTLTVSNNCGDQSVESTLSVIPKYVFNKILINEDGPYCSTQSVEISVVDNLSDGVYTAEDLAVVYTAEKLGSGIITNPMPNPFTFPVKDNVGEWRITAEGNCVEPQIKKITIASIEAFSDPVVDKQTVCLGETAQFIVRIDQVPEGSNLEYRWIDPKKVDIVSDKSANTLSISAVQLENAGEYKCFVKNRCGLEKEVSVNLEVETVTSKLYEEDAVCENTAKYSLKFGYEGTPKSFKWRFVNNSNVESELGTKAEYLIPLVNVDHEGDYYCDVELKCGPVIYHRKLVVNENVTASNNTVDLDICEGEKAALSITTNGKETSIKWIDPNGDALTAWSGNKINTTNKFETAGIYTFKYIVGGICKDVEGCFDVVVHDKPSITPIDPITACEGDVELIMNVVCDDDNYTPTWTKFGSTTSWTGLSHVLVGAVSDDSGKYIATVNTDFCDEVSATAQVEIIEPINFKPGIETDIKVCVGDALNILAETTGEDVTYKWYKLPDETNPISIDKNLDLKLAEKSEEGIYKCVLIPTRACENVSLHFTVDVREPASFPDLHDFYDCTSAGAAVFDATASGEGSFTYQWFNKDGKIDGETDETLTITDLAGNDGQLYSCEVTNDRCGVLPPKTVNLNVKKDIHITHHPVGVIVAENGEATFSVIADGFEPTYQWRENGIDMPSENKPTLVINPATLDLDGNKYSCYVSNTCSSQISDEALLEITQDPRIVDKLKNQKVCQGAELTFKVEYNNTTTACVWEYSKDGVSYLPATGSTSIGTVEGADPYSILKITSAKEVMNTWKFRVRVQRNDFSDNISNDATVEVFQPVSYDIIGDKKICSKDGAEFVIKSLSETSSWTYSWKRGTEELKQLDGLSLPAPVDISKPYHVTVSNGVCDPKTTDFKLSNFVALELNEIAGNKLICFNTPSELSISPLHIDPAKIGALKYVWSKGATVLSKESNKYTVAADNVSQTGLYSVEVSDGCMSATKTADITVLAQVTASSTMNREQDVCMGSDLNLVVDNLTGADLHYKWYNEADLTKTRLGIDAPIYKIKDATAADAFVYCCEVSSEYGCDTPVVEFNVSVHKLTVITGDPKDFFECSTAPEAKFIVEASGSGTLTYNWFDKADNPVVGVPNTAKTKSELTIPNADLGRNDGNSFYCKVSSSLCNTVASETANLSLKKDVAITHDPLSLTVDENEDAEFTVVASGTPELSYQWYKVGTPDKEVAGGDKAILQFNPAHVSDAGDYYCKVTNECAEDISKTVTLTVNTVRKFVSQPDISETCFGNDYTFTVDYKKAGNMTCAWEVNKNVGHFVSVGTLGNAVKTTIDPLLDRSTLTVNSNVLPGTDMNGWEFRAIVSGDLSTETSTEAIVTVFEKLDLGAKEIVDLCIGKELQLEMIIPADTRSFSYSWVDKKGDEQSKTKNLDLKSENIVKGVYTLTVNDGFCDAVTKEYEVGYFDPLVISDIDDNSICFNKEEIFTIGVTSIKHKDVPTYIWSHAGIDLSETSNTLSVLNNALVKQGSYQVSVFDGCDTKTNNFQVTALPEVTASINGDANPELCEGESKNLLVTTTGKDLTFKWTLNHLGIVTPLTSTINKLELKDVKTANAGLYRCEISSACIATPIVLDYNVIVRKHATMTIPDPFFDCLKEGPAVFTIDAIKGVGKVDYQWYDKDDRLVAGAVNPIFSVSKIDLPANDGQSYYCKAITEYCNDVKSAQATLDIKKDIFITEEPKPLVIAETGTAIFKVKVTGYKPNYQWFKDGAEITGATNHTYTIANVVKGGNYKCVITGECNEVETKVVVLTVDPTKKIITHPIDQRVCNNEKLTKVEFVVAYTNVVDECVWEYSDAVGNPFIPIDPTLGMKVTPPSLFKSVLTIDDKLVSKNGWLFRARVKITGGAFEKTNFAKLSVFQPVTFDLVGATEICENAGAEFELENVKGEPTQYSWKRGTNEILDLTKLTLPAPVDITETYHVSVSNEVCPAVKKDFTISNFEDLVLNDISGDNSICFTEPEELNILVDKHDDLLTTFKYIWKKDGKDLGNISNKHTVSGDNINQSGLYSVDVSDKCMTVTKTLDITVLEKVTASSSMIGILDVCMGSDLTLDVDKLTGDDLHYKWYNKADPLTILGTDSHIYKIERATATDAFVYCCEVSSGFGCDKPVVDFNVSVHKLTVIEDDPKDFFECLKLSDAKFQVTAIGSGTLSYQWYDKTNKALAGKINPALTVSNVDLIDNNGNSFYCQVSSSLCNTVASETAKLDLKENVAITHDPLSLTVDENEDAEFTVVASGTPELSYQWYKVGTPDKEIAGGDKATYRIDPVHVSDAGDYYCIASNECTDAKSKLAILTVNTVRKLVSQPDISKTCFGKDYAFTVDYNKAGNMTCAWEVDKNVGHFVSVGTLGNAVVTTIDPLLDRSTLTVNSNAISLTDMNGWKFRVVVSGDLSPETSKEAIVTVYKKLDLGDKETVDLCIGKKLQLEIMLPADPRSFSYSWVDKNGDEQSKTKNLDRESADIVKGVYTLTVNDGFCDAVNKEYEVGHYDPLVISDIDDNSICFNKEEVFTIEVTSKKHKEVPTYKWTKGADDLGKTNTLKVFNDASTKQGSYEVAVFDGCETKTDDFYLTTLTKVTASIKGDANPELCEGESQNLLVSTTGEGLTFKWTFDPLGTPKLLTSIINKLELKDVKTANAGLYRCEISSACIAAPLVLNYTVIVRKHATVTNPDPFFDCLSAAPAVFTVVATGSGDLSYEWFDKDNLLVPGAISTTLSILQTDLIANEGQKYHCKVTPQFCNEAISSEATLNIKEDVVIKKQPKNVTLTEGTNDRFEVEAIGYNLSYQWFKNAIALKGETNAILNLVDVKIDDAADYSCVVKGDCRSLKTDAAVLIVNKEGRIISEASDKKVCEKFEFFFELGFKNTSTACIWEVDKNDGDGFKPVNASIGTTTKFDENTPSRLTIPIATAEMSDWKFRAKVEKAGYSTDYSKEVRVKVYIPASFVDIPNKEICKNTPLSFSIEELKETGSFSYRWMSTENTADISDDKELGSSINLNLDANQTKIGKYYLEVRDGICPVIKDEFTISHFDVLVVKSITDINPVCHNNPEDLVATISKDDQLSVTYKWFKGSDDIVLGELNTYTVQGKDKTESGLYTLKASDKCMTASKSTYVNVLNEIIKTSSWENQDLCLDDNLLLEAKVTGDSPTYTWTVPVGSIDPGDVASLKIDEIAEADAGTYTCVISAPCGDDVEYTAIVNVNKAPSISSGIESLAAICEGDELELGPIIYDATRGESIQWKFENKTLDGETFVSLKLGSAGLSMEGNYRVEVSNACGEDFSLGFQDIHPIPTLDPIADQTACQGENVIFRAVATGEDLTYRWFVNEHAQDAFNDKAELVISDILAEDPYTVTEYKVECKISACATPLNSIAYVEVKPNTILYSPIKGGLKYVGESHKFSLNVSGYALDYEWHYTNAEGVDVILSETSSTLELNNLKLTDTGEYSCVISSECGIRFTSAYLRVKDPLKIVEGLNNLTKIEKCFGEALNLNITVKGEVNSIDWFKGDENLNHHDLNYLISSLDIDDTGSYRCEIEGEGANLSETVNLIVYQSTVLKSHLQDQNLCEDQNLLWIPNVVGSNLSYDWQYNGASISKESSLNISGLKMDQAGLYTVDVWGECGSVKTEGILQLQKLPFYISHSGNPPVCENTEEAIFTVNYGGDRLIYQWQKNGENIEGATSPELKIRNVRIADEGIYTCVINSNCNLQLVSPVMKLVVIPQLKILNESDWLEICEGEEAQFSVEVIGTNPVYQWQHNGENIHGANTAQYSITSSLIAEGGYYTCMVSDKCTSKRYSKSQKLMINALPNSQILGRLKLCVLEDRVAYNTPLQPDINYGWVVEGGEFTTSAIGSKTKITWGDILENGKVKLKIQNERTGCYFEIDSLVELRPLPDVSLAGLESRGVCESEFELKGGFPEGGIYWVNGVAQNSFEPSHGNGNYVVRYSYTDEFGCSNTSMENVLRIDSLPKVKLIDDVVVGACRTQQLWAETDLDNIKWSPARYLDDPNSKKPMFSSGESILYVATVVDRYGCVGNDIVNVTVAPLPLITTINDTLIGECKEIELTTHIVGDISEIKWDHGDHLSKSTISNPMLIKAPVGVNNYHINVTDKYGCVVSESVQVEVKPNPEIGDNQLLCEGDKFTVNIRNLSNPIWSDGYKDWSRIIDKPGEYVLRVSEFDCELKQTIVMHPTPKISLRDTLIFEGQTVRLDPDLDPEYGLYFYDWSDGSELSYLEVDKSNTFKLEVEDNIGCVAIDSVVVVVKPIGIESPNAFSPESGNENDRFYLKEINLKEINFMESFEMYVYNRWGEMVYKTTEAGYSGGWDGTYRGEKCPTGVYVWILILDGEMTEKGNLVLVR